MSVSMKTIIYIVMSAVSGVAILLLFLLNRRFRISKRKEDVFFRYLCAIEIVYCATVIIKNMDWLFATQNPFGFWPLVFSTVPQILLVLSAQMWVLFVDYYINGSMDEIKRRYRLFYIPYLFILVIGIFGVLLLKRMESETVNGLEDVSVRSAALFILWLLTYYIVSVVTVVWYIVKAIKIVRYHKTERDRPLLLRLDVFAIPWAVAYFFELLPTTSVYIEPLCAAISLILTFYIIQKRYQYIDEETQFYNESFIDYLKKYFLSRKVNDVILVSVRGKNASDTARAVSACRPEKSMIFRIGEDTFLIMAHNPGEVALRSFKELLRAQYSAFDDSTALDVETFVQTKEENFEELVNRAGL